MQQVDFSMRSEGLSLERVEMAEKGTIPAISVDAESVHQSGKEQVEETEERQSKLNVWLKEHKRVAEMLEKDDWISVWIGASTFLVLVTFAALNVQATFVPHLWSNNPLKAVERTSAFRSSTEQKSEMNSPAGARDVALGLLWLLAMLPGMLLPMIVCGWKMFGGKQKVRKILPGFCAMFLLGFLGRILGVQSSLKGAGIGSTVWTIILGMLLSNVVARFCSLAWIEPAAKHAEFYIKIGLVLLAVELTTMGKYGVGGLVVAWGVTPVCVACVYWLGVVWLSPSSSHSLVAILACGISICGGSAITACASAIKAPQDEQALAISIVSFFTIFFMLALPYAALALGLDLRVAAAWIGGSVNNTGNVVASVAIIDNASDRPDGGGACPGPGCPGEMGPVVKMAQNAALGVIVVGVTVYWLMFEETTDGNQSFARLPDPAHGEGDEEEGPVPAAPVAGSSQPAGAQGSEEAGRAGGGAGSGGGGTVHSRRRNLKWPTAGTLWDRFPKFVLGFLVLSVVVTLLAATWMGHKSRGAEGEGRRPLDDVLSALDDASDWWFTLGFVGIGINTDLSKMAAKLQGGSVVALYLVGQMLNVGLTLLVAWIVYDVA